MVLTQDIVMRASGVKAIHQAEVMTFPQTSGIFPDCRVGQRIFTARPASKAITSKEIRA
jgi:hypothetical protein